MTKAQGPRPKGLGASPNEGGASLVFFLSPRGTSGERTEERGCPKNEPPLPSPLLHPMEEREEYLHRPHSEMRPKEFSS